ncbi:CsoS2 family carboxysome shell protein [Lamprocystis purpurea]|jgi:hypothetical protein|uniref:CsoS2 family carboxysome shell protein n=1 Tax=Lamprocystis purpurea TaxID=61598 RepID=UPI0003A63FE6|nr:CsoS2 family carboxysome shell protein [Lamprocystis purpurea]
MSGPTPTTALSGKALALARRRDQAQRGGRAQSSSAGARNAPRTAAPARPEPVPRPSGVDPVAAPAQAQTFDAPADLTPASTTAVPAGMSPGGATNGRDLARARRAAQARAGAQGRPSRPARQRSGATAFAGSPAAPLVAPAAQSAVVSAGAEPVGSGESGAGDADLLDAICSLVEAAPSNEGLPASVRELCRERRRDLSHRGQAALPASPRGLAAGRGSARIRPGAAGPAVSVRDLARQRRAELGKNGRGTPSDYRPSGRVRPPAPAKVALGTTLSGSAVTGTLVERNPKVTGNEPGTCRVITGTEYIGAEQFDQFCGTRPLPPVPKVGVSATSQGQRMTGTEVGRSPRVTGDESGACRSVTGTEYLGSEALADFCPSSPGNTMLPARPAKVAVGATERKGLVVTGTDEARSGAVTGADAGARRAVTGSQYADAGLARLTINGPPSKVALTHTLAGRPVSGTEVGRSVKVTGDEAGACRPVSGTEYLSNEQFQTICRTRPEPPPPKVGEDSSRAGQRITGNLVDRSPKVTGNEPGACERVTGSQYGQTSLCDGAPVKVSAMHTLAGRTLTGTAVSLGADPIPNLGPKLTGDEHGECQLVTGTEYVGQEQYQAYCEGTPAPRADKVGVSRTERGQQVSGVMLGRSPLVTGNEPGSASAITGTPYGGGPRQGQSEGCACGGACGCGGHSATQPRVETAPAAPAPAARRVPRYLAPADQPLPYAEPRPPAAPGPADFSIVSPARAARGRITGNALGSVGSGGLSRITGPVNLAAGLVSGTPEFRYRDEQPTDYHAPAFSAPAAVAAAPAVPMEEPVGRITGEGRDSGRRITGDDWARSGRVTGTEGHWAQGRNLTLRGENRLPMAAGAWGNKDLERPAPPPPARVTGSSGGNTKGTCVTYSGGARG